MTHPLTAIPKSFHAGHPTGITSVCTAHPDVIAATLTFGKDGIAPVLIEATCNQVNQDGGYTGMTPADFRDYVFGIADKVGFPRERLVLGGDHLGPNPWRKLDAETAMDKAVTLVDAYARAGFSKIHLDASMACAGRDRPCRPTSSPTARHGLPQWPKKRCARPDSLRRSMSSARSAGAGWRARKDRGAGADRCGGSRRDAGTASGEVRGGWSCRCLSAGDRARRSAGVEFGNENVVPFDPPRAGPLTDWLRTQNQIVFEAHSTDYQTEAALSALVKGGFGILKVGPGLTFAMREAITGSMPWPVSCSRITPRARCPRRWNR